MKLGFALLATLLSAPSCHAAGISDQRGWVASSVPPSPEETVSIRVLLVQPRVAELEASLQRVSDPRSPTYGQHLKPEEVASLVALPAEQLSAALAAFECGTVPALCTLSVHRDSFLLRTTVTHAESLLSVTFRSFVHPSGEGTTTLLRSTDSPVLPVAAAELVDFLQGVVDFPSPRLRHRVSSSSSSSSAGKGASASQPGSDVDPSVLRKQYGVSSGTSSVGRGSVSCAEFEGEAFKQADVDEFTSFYAIPEQGVNLVGPNNGGYYGEGTLDVEYLIGTMPGLNTTFWSIKWTEFGKDLLQWAMDVQASPSPPLVHSISWGSSEAGTASYDVDTMVRTNTEFAKMGAIGLSVLIASGDEGTGHTGSLRVPCGTFAPNWPATSPFATAVGGTYLNGTTEIAWADSGGGFSNLWARPSWQDAAVSAYLQREDLPDKQYFNVSGRAIPDVAALATNFRVRTSGGGSSVVSGTSAAAPVFAALVAYVNEQRILSGKPSLGFLNPALYAMAEVGTDVTEGANKDPACAAGFPAAPGWDAVTGLGTPTLAALMSLAQL